MFLVENPSETQNRRFLTFWYKIITKKCATPRALKNETEKQDIITTEKLHFCSGPHFRQRPRAGATHFGLAREFQSTPLPEWRKSL
jgi:hypothetical protein